ncbi:protein kintoun isoform X1 [Equus caballus]|uniref:protein kintoun isoform X1 n=1 Tax=Equus caballus TaxID=9796 RepID=UPI0038B40BD6
MQGSCGLKFYQGYSGISTIPLRLLPLLSPGCCRCHQGNQHARPTLNSRPVPQPPTALSAPAAARRVPRPGPGPVSGGLWAGAAGSMARAAASSALEDLDLSAEEVQRLTSAFRDPEFRRLFSDYAEELTDPDNRRRYEAEITALERERGVDVRFVHPEPGHVLRTSLDGARRGFVNVCSNALVDAPRGRPDGHWSLPYSLAPGREYLGRRGGRYTVYDVVFHPRALALARRHERFRRMLDDAALDAVETQWGVRVDGTNAKTLKIKYKGTPEAAVLRAPLPGAGPARPEGEPEGPLPGLPYPYPPPAPRPAARPPAPAPPAAGPPRAPTEPRYSVVQRHHVDLQDYRCARDSAPGPVPHELVVTIELPLLRSAEQVALEVTGRLLCLDSRAPDYRLRLSLPYPVDDSRGTAQFHRARRQLLLTLPVVRPAPRPAAPEEPARAPGTDGPGPEQREREEEEEAPEEEEGRRERKDREEGELERREEERGEEKQREEEEEREQRAEERQRQEERDHREEEEPEEEQRGERRGEEEEREKEEPERREEEQPEEEQRGERRGEEEEREQQWEERGPGERAVWTAAVGEEPPPGAGSLPGTSAGSPGRGPGAGAGGARGDPRGEAMGGPGAARREPVCPPSRCRQDEESLTLLVQVPRIQPQSLQGDLSPVGYQLRFSTQDLGSYAFSLRFAPENQLSCRAPAVSVSPHNAVIELAKAPGCRGPWREWYYGPHGGSLEERLFVNEENVNEVLEEVLSSPSTWTEPLTPPLIEVLQVTDSKIQIHAKLQECSNSEQLHENEETVNEGSHLTEKESTEHSTSFPSESADSSGAVQVLETDSCGSAAHLQQESLDISKMSLGKSEQSESKMEPEFIKEKRAVYSNEEKDNLKEPVTTEEELLDDHLSSLLNKTTVHSGSGFDNIKETNMQDGSVQIIKDHVTHCAFSFQNSLLYDLD